MSERKSGPLIEEARDPPLLQQKNRKKSGRLSTKKDSKEKSPRLFKYPKRAQKSSSNKKKERVLEKRVG